MATKPSRAEVKTTNTDQEKSKRAGTEEVLPGQVPQFPLHSTPWLFNDETSNEVFKVLNATQKHFRQKAFFFFFSIWCRHFCITCFHPKKGCGQKICLIPKGTHHWAGVIEIPANVVEVVSIKSTPVTHEEKINCETLHQPSVDPRICTQSATCLLTVMQYPTELLYPTHWDYSLTKFTFPGMVNMSWQTNAWAHISLPPACLW